MKLLQSLCVILLLFTSSLSKAADSAGALMPSEQSSLEGYYTLRWDYSRANFSILQMSRDQSFAAIEQTYPVPSMQQVTLSGYRDGQYFFRLFDEQSNRYSNVVAVTVQHRSLNTAFQLFALGLVLFIILLSILLSQSRRRDR